MRFMSLLKWDMRFQARYGFYLLYGFLTVLYVALLVAGVLAVSADCRALWLVLLGTFLSSVLFTLVGMIIATKTTSLNQFILATVPVELLAFVPVILHLAGITPDFLRIYPANACMDLIAGRDFSMAGLILTVALIAVLFFAAQRCVRNMWTDEGGVKL